MMKNDVRQLNIPRLQSGGLITNYYCSSRCMHCLYTCSPQRPKEYIDKTTALEMFEKSKRLGCGSLHIGGGEPMLNPGKLTEVLKAAQESGVTVQYVETNSSWYKDHQSACEILEELRAASLSTLLVSISPFHNEYIPFYKVKGVMAACRETGISIFPWIADCYEDIDSFPDDKPHAMSEYLDKFGPNYLKKVMRIYWIHPGGRALSSLFPIFGKQKLRDLLTDCTGCRELTDTSHFHFDLNGNYIPGLCSGIQIDSRDLGSPLPAEKYPFIHLLYNKGIGALYEIAVDKYGFSPREHYASKCQLCHEIRRFLVTEKEVLNGGPVFNEFGPKSFYNDGESERI